MYHRGQKGGDDNGDVITPVEHVPCSRYHPSHCP